MRPPQLQEQALPNRRGESQKAQKFMGELLGQERSYPSPGCLCPAKLVPKKTEL